MAFLLRVAQRREGVDNLVDCGIVETLTDCGFLDQRPEEDVVQMMDSDSFVPSARETYHQLLVPALQLIVSVLSKVGRDNASIVGRVSQFVAAHQNVLVAILKDKSVRITIASLMELKLVTAIFSYLAGNEELLQQSLPGPGHMTFHNALVALLNKYALPEKWHQRLTPVSDVEREQDQIIKFSGVGTGMSLFHERAHDLVQDICRNLLAYCRAVTENMADTRKPARLVFTCSMSMGKENDAVASTAGAAPSIGLMVLCLKNMVNALFQSIDDRKNVRIKIAEVHKLPMEEINEICSRSAEPFIEELSTSQRQQFAVRELQRDGISRTKAVLSLLYMVEHVLLLLWRHLDFYLHRLRASGARQSSLSTAGGTAADAIDAGRMDVENLRTDVATTLLPIVGKLVAIELPKDVIGNVSARSAFIQMLIRRIRELIQHTVDSDFLDG
ncbi:hypothetical protein HK102_005296 [Quaeritorhiza haematococci]|nr:hypothetical protein HK102_005296 [Quaeritorhiza haematococci]